MPLRVAVVTPYFAETTEVLRQTHESVLGQSYPCRHILVADGRPNPAVAGWDAEHIVLPGGSDDFGSTPRFVGAADAVLQGYDLVAFLDADNWLRADHVQSLADLQQETGAGFLSCGRMLARLDGSILAPCPLTDPDRFVDTSCMAFARPGFGLLSYWVTMPAYGKAICDRCMLAHAKASDVVRAHTPERTLFYRCGKAGIYQMFGEEPPPGVIPAPDYQSVFARWEAEGHPPLV